MKSISHGHGELAHQVGHEEHGALEHADQQQVAALVVGRDLGSELGDPRPQRVLARSGSRRRPRGRVTSPRPPGSPARRPPSRAPRRSPGTATTSPPRRRRAASRRAPPAAPSRPRADPAPSCAGLRAGPPAGARGRRARRGRVSSRHGPHVTAPSSRSVSYSRTARTPPPRSAPSCRRATRELDERRLERARQPRPLAGEREQVGVGARVEPPQQRQHLVADQPALRVGVRRVDAAPAGRARGSTPRSPRA